MARTHRFQELLEGSITARGAVGGALTVATENDVVECVVGITSALQPAPVDADTLFRIESHTKIFTATVVFQLRDMGLLSLDDLVLDHLSDVPAGALSEVTIRQLLSHQSGLADLPLQTFDSWDQPIDRVARAVAQSSRLFGPGQSFSYSGAAFAVIAAMVEELTGLRWNTVLVDAVLSPFGLAHSCLTADQALALRTAVGHCFNEQSLAMEPTTPPCARGLLPTEGMFASASDLLRLSSLYVRHPKVPLADTPIISAQSSMEAGAGEREMESAFAPGMWQGMPWQVARWCGREILMHQSFGRGTSGNIMIDRNTGVGFALLVNSDTGENVCIDVSQALLRELLGVSVPSHPESAELSGRDVAGYAGKYMHDADHCYVVEAIDRSRLALLATDVYQLAESVHAAIPMKQLDHRRFAYQSGSVLFGMFDDAGIPHSLHFRNRIARRVDDAAHNDRRD